MALAKFTTQWAIFSIEKSMAVDKDKSLVLLLADMSKASCGFPQEVQVAKCQAYGFSMSFLQFIYSYLSNRKQIIKINESHLPAKVVKSLETCSVKLFKWISYN